MKIPKGLERLKKLRSYIIANPGQTWLDIAAATGLNGVLDLQRKGLAYWKKDEHGATRWYVKANLAYPNVGKNNENET